MPGWKFLFYRLLPIKLSAPHLRRFILFRGFTLVELLVVIALVAILAAVALAVINLVSMQNRSKEAVVSANLDKMSHALTGCFVALGVSTAADIAGCNSWLEISVTPPTQPTDWNYNITSNTTSGFTNVSAYPDSCSPGGADCCEMRVLIYFDYRVYLSKPSGTVLQDNDCSGSNYSGEL